MTGYLKGSVLSFCLLDQKTYFFKLDFSLFITLFYKLEMTCTISILDNRPCSNTSSPDSCIRIGEDTFFGFSDVKSWYKAYDECQKVGASLAVLDSYNKFKQLLDYNKQHHTMGYLDLLYIGLTNHRWMPISRHISKFHY